MAHGFHPEVVGTQPERMEGEIQVAAPEQPAFGINRTQVFCGIQSLHTGQQDDCARGRFGVGGEKRGLIRIPRNLGKSPHFPSEAGDVPDAVLPSDCTGGKDSNSIHEITPFCGLVVFIISKTGSFSSHLARTV